jgi:hypothetical protein
MWVDVHRFISGDTLTQKVFEYVGKNRMFFVAYRYQSAYKHLEPQFKGMVDSIQIRD